MGTRVKIITRIFRSLCYSWEKWGTTCTTTWKIKLTGECKKVLEGLVFEVLGLSFETPVLGLTLGLRFRGSQSDSLIELNYRAYSMDTQSQTVPFRKVPFRKIPFRKIPFRKVPFRKIPFRKIPFRKVPFRKIPFRKIPFHFVSFRFANYRKPM